MKKQNEKHTTDSNVAILGVNYADLRALNKVLKKLVMSVQPTFITLTGTPQPLSATASVATNSGVQ